MLALRHSREVARTLPAQDAMDRSEYQTTQAITRRASLRPRSDEKPYIVGIAGEHACRFFPLHGLKEVTIGRTTDCEIPVLLDDSVSRRQARITISPAGDVALVDLNSSNGTLVNGREVKETSLQRGDRIFLGHETIFKFDYFSDEERGNWETASVDALTEVYNRGFFDARLAEYFTIHAANNRPLSLIMVDVDHFKLVNDQHGHPAGDHVLHQVASKIVLELEHADIGALTCRYGGEEFGILVPSCDRSAAGRIAEALRNAVAVSTFQFEGTVLRVTVSCGTATFVPPSGFESPERLLQAADTNLYAAKHQGRNRVVVG